MVDDQDTAKRESGFSPNPDDIPTLDASAMVDVPPVAEPEHVDVLAVPLGQTLPSVERLPVLPTASARSSDGANGGLRHSMVAAGLSFIGVAEVEGSITVAGEVQGNIRVIGTPDGHVTVTETGTVVGDVSARHISVLGQTVGTLDAGGGEVTLHSSSSVAGRVRYTHLQVNGADLNAQLERVRQDDANPPGR